MKSSEIRRRIDQPRSARTRFKRFKFVVVPRERLVELIKDAREAAAYADSEYVLLGEPSFADPIDEFAKEFLGDKS